MPILIKSPVILNYRLVAPLVEISSETAIVVEGKGLILTCDASGKPEPAVTWTKVGSSKMLSNTSLLTIVNVSRPGTPDNMIQYQCTASNGVGTPATASSTVDVYCKQSENNLTLMIQMITLPDN